MCPFILTSPLIKNLPLLRKFKTLSKVVFPAPLQFYNYVIFKLCVMSIKDYLAPMMAHSWPGFTIPCTWYKRLFQF